MSHAFCSFCGASNSQRRLLMMSDDKSAGICDQCTNLAVRALRDYLPLTYTFWLGAEAEAL